VFGSRHRAAIGESMAADQAIVVGGGLAGVSAANTIIESNGTALLIDKSAFCG